MKLPHKKSFLFLMVFFIFISAFLPSRAFSMFSQFDLEERKGTLHPQNTKVRSYNFGKINKTTEEHVLNVSLHYLSYAEKWNENKLIPEDYAKAIGASFTWVCALKPQEAQKFEPIINNLIAKKFMNIENLWINGLPEIKIENLENGLVRFIDPGPLHFKKRMFSDFTGTNLFIGGQHSEKFPVAQYLILDVDINVNPDIIGNANNLSHIQCFPSDKFENVIFDHIGHIILEKLDLMKEYLRIVKNGGHFSFRTEHGPQEYTQNILKIKKKTFIQIMKASGFKSIQIEIKEDKENEIYEDYPWYLLITADVEK